MPFSMPSYFLGVGTVVGALAFGFGGGVLLTRTAIKDTPPNRIERAARAETPAAPQIAEARAVPVPRADPSTVMQPAPEPAPQVQAAAENPKPVADTPREEPVKAAEPVKQIDPPKQIEQREAEQQLSAREQRRAERRIERERRYAERKARAMVSVRMRQQPVEDAQQEERQPPARPELAFEREAPRPNLFEGLFGRPQDAAPGDGRE
jgi:hypothetical protein